ncbi:unnamed protein product [Brachionus calyciflorus]|uniref:Uncharacterized protein n=1 Tax=Brachionus calyciflorus TaxID=104777 RepID=A0A814CQ35_9BILA|nr:unnamed protein product [Brachionus calyciflorus]
MSAPKASVLFNRVRQFAARNKSTYVYDVDKTFGQRWVEKHVKKQQKLQKFYSDESIPLWWKTTGDKFITTFVFAATIATFGVSLVNLAKYSQGKL